jgi:hypothetical protein
MNLKKILLISFLGILLIAIGFIGYIMLTTKSHSPAGRMEFTDGEFNLAIDYCRPYKKGRLIFGEEIDGALLPYGEYWRTGANEATEIEFNREISINGKQLSAGRYRFYTIPGESVWTIAFNSELGEWGYGEPNYELDLLRLEVPVIELSESLEQFTISGMLAGDKKMDIILTWDITQIKIPVNF